MPEPNPYELNPWIWKAKTLEMAQDLEIAIKACQRIKGQCAPEYTKEFDRLEARFKQLKEQAESFSEEFSRIIEEEAR